MLTRALGAVLCLLLCTPGDAFAETTEATGTAPLISTVHAAVGHRHRAQAWSSCHTHLRISTTPRHSQ